MSKRWYRSRAAVIVFHVLAWVLLFSIPVLLRREEQNHVSWKNMVSIRSLIFDACCVSFFYLNSLVLLPRLLNRKRMGAYILTILLLFSVLVTAVNVFGKYEEGPKDSPDKNSAPAVKSGFRRETLFIMFPYLFFWAMSTVYWFVAEKIKNEQTFKEKENENLKTELSFLRSQISPHFLFNVMNNMVAMARLRSDQLEPSLIRLSGLLRYMLYESVETSVTLNREVEYVHSYIELQKLRYAKSLFIKLDMDPGDNQLIEPMLLIPFIENAFKHGTGLIADPDIDISLRITPGLLDFRIQNKYIPESSETKDRVSGIGLNNVKRRLNLLYDQRHMLDISTRDGLFSVALQIKLH